VALPELCYGVWAGILEGFGEKGDQQFYLGLFPDKKI